MVRRIAVILVLLVAGLAGAGAGCGSTAGGGGSCADGGALTYTTFGQGFMGKYCVSCHGSGRTEAGVVLTSLSGVRSRASQVDAVAGSGASMPPLGSTAPSSAERASLSQWIACGAP